MEKPIDHNEGSMNNEIINVKPFIPLNNFKTKLGEEIHIMEERTYGTEKIMVPVLQIEKAKELSEGFWKLYDTSNTIFKNYWKKDISKKGNKFHEGDVPISGYPDRIRRYIYGENSGITFGDLRGDINVKERFYETLSLAFDVYACIKYLQPDSIIALVNGANRLSAICEAIGFKTSKLSIHRDAGPKANKGSYRDELSNEIDYDGDEIRPGSRILLLEDTSSLGEGRTYRDARKWLADKGVTDTPVFMERMAALSGDAHFPITLDKIIDTQKHLDDEYCFLSLSIFKPNKNSEYWKKTKGSLTKIIEDTPELYSDFFNLIRKLGKGNKAEY